MEQLQVVVEDLFFGSLGTTGNLLAFAILFMVLNPDKQTKVRQVICNNEVDQNTFSAAELKRLVELKQTQYYLRETGADSNFFLSIRARKLECSHCSQKVGIFDFANRLESIAAARRILRLFIVEPVELKKFISSFRKPYVKATILEILRKGNIGPIPATRVALADVKYKDYIIPKVPQIMYKMMFACLYQQSFPFCQDTVLFYNLHPIYADKAYWKDPEAFRPERYLNENGDIDQSKSDRVLKTVFGAGTI